MAWKNRTAPKPRPIQSLITGAGAHLFFSSLFSFLEFEFDSRGSSGASSASSSNANLFCSIAGNEETAALWMPHATRNVGGSRTPHAQVQSLALSLFQWNIPRGAIVLLACVWQC
eukprot:294047-Prorocentrum_minimum.AAC.2